MTLQRFDSLNLQLETSDLVNQPMKIWGSEDAVAVIQEFDSSIFWETSGLLNHPFCLKWVICKENANELK